MEQQQPDAAANTPTNEPTGEQQLDDAVDGEDEKREPFPLHVAVRGNDVEQVRIVLERLHHSCREQLGTLINSRDDEGATPLHWAVRLRNPNAISSFVSICKEMLLDLDMNAQSSEGLTPLQELLNNCNNGEQEEQDLACLQALCQAGEGKVDVNVIDPYTGTPPIWDCLSNGLSAAIPVLLQRGADIHIVSAEGESLLFPAVSSDDDASVQLLLDAGVDLNRQNLEGFTVLHVAAYSGQINMVRLLLETADKETGAKTGRRSLFIKNEQGNTPRMEAEMSGNTECAQILASYEEQERRDHSSGDIYYSADEQDLFSPLIKTNKPLALQILSYLEDPSDLCAIEAVSVHFHQISKQYQDDIWHDLFMRWYGDSNDVVEGKPHLWGVVYGQSRPVFYACKAFMEGTWKQRFKERALLASCDPCTNHKIDLKINVHFVNGGGYHTQGEGGVVDVLQSTILFPRQSFEYIRYGATAFATSCGRTESVEISSPESADVCIICFPVFESKLYTTIEPKLEGVSRSCPKLLVGVLDMIPVAELRIDKQEAVEKAMQQFGCGYLECSVQRSSGVKAIFEEAVSLYTTRTMSRGSTE